MGSRQNIVQSTYIDRLWAALQARDWPDELSGLGLRNLDSTDFWSRIVRTIEAHLYLDTYSTNIQEQVGS